MKTSSSRLKISRRHFLATTAAAVAFPTIIPGKVLGRQGAPSPSNRITVGVIGWGMQGPQDTQTFLRNAGCRVVAACDLDKTHLDDAVTKINTGNKSQDCKAYHDYRELLARADIDAVLIAVPDHWHALVATEAAKQKKDIYCEKPLARTIAEQQAIVKIVKANDLIWQTGSWQRSTANFHKGAEIVRNGLIGKITHVEVGLPSGHTDFAGTGKELTPSEPPPELDYETWIGPSKMMPYIKARIHRNWRWNYNTGGGQLLDWIGHHCDIAHWGMDCDLSGPSEIEGKGEFPPADAVWNTCTKYKIELQYPRNMTMTIADSTSGVRMGTKWIGPDGWVHVDRGVFESSNEDWQKGLNIDEKLRKVRLYESTDHTGNFIDCVKSRKPTITPVDVAHHSAIPGHLSLISMMLGRKLKWDVASEKILGDDEATKLLTRPYRPPWQLA